MDSGFIALYVILSVIAVIVWVVAWAEIFFKAGYNRWLCFGMIVPILNIVIFLLFAYSKWPISESRLRISKLRSQRAKIDREISNLEQLEKLQEGQNTRARPSSIESQEVSKRRIEDYQYIGDSQTGIFHKLTCHSVRLIGEKDMDFFSSKGEAERAGYKPCQACMA